MTTRSAEAPTTSTNAAPTAQRSESRAVASSWISSSVLKLALVAIAVGLVSTVVACSSPSTQTSDGIDYQPATEGSDTDASTPQQCAGSTVACGSQCVNLAAATAHCGSCGNACATGETCESGVCKASAANCPAGQTDCSGTCVDTSSDAANCGTCTNACGGAQTCLSGACSVGCAAGSVQCGGTCVDPISSHDHCGATPGCGVSGAGTAGVKCDLQSECIGGSCYSQCTGDTISCGSDCVDSDTDSDNCGSCGNKCGSGQACSVGMCCSANETACQGQCRDLTSNHDSCGGCGIVCNGNQDCVDSLCVDQN